MVTVNAVAFVSQELATPFWRSLLFRIFRGVC